MSHVASTNAEPKQHPLPCVVQIGFAGSRRLFDLPEDDSRLETLHGQVLEQLLGVLRSLKADLKLGDRHFICGISQVAIGADTIFTEACHQLDAEGDEHLAIAQRIFLPQHSDVYVDAVGSDGARDFSPDEKKKAQALLQSEHIVEVRLVSHSHNREGRFEECNRQIVRASDAAICLVRADAEGKAGGTLDLLKRAKTAEIPTLEIPVRLEDGAAVLGQAEWEIPFGWQPPGLPDELEGVLYEEVEDSGPLPSVAEFSDAVAREVGTRAERYSRRFSRGARIIIGTHILATALAAGALVLGKIYLELGPVEVSAVAVLLVCELLALAYGLRIHYWLHRTSPSSRWALSRLLAEIHRSTRATNELYLYPQYLFQLRLPQDLDRLLRTLCVLHLRSSRGPSSRENWKKRATTYVYTRLTCEDYRKGQIAYYNRRRDDAKNSLEIATRMFAVFAWLAVLATSVKLAMILEAYKLLPDEYAVRFANLEEGWLVEALGVLAVVLPVLAVGAMSWASAMNYEARVHTFDEMADRLEKQKRKLEAADSEEEFLDTVMETEAMLLAETAEWYSRRRFTGVA